jgi:hypothetical protein
MNPCRKTTRLDWHILSLVAVFALLVSACNGNGTPTSTLAEPTVPPEPSPAPEPTETPISHEVIITFNPNVTDIQAGDEIAILLSFDPPAGVDEAKWEFVVGSGTIEPPAGGDAVVFTAPEDEEGSVIIKVSGKTTDGASFEKNFTFNVIAPLPPPDCVFTAAMIAPPTLLQSSLIGTFTAPERCSSELEVAKPVAATGTASDIPQDVFLWLFVLPPNGRYYPQCNDAAEGLCGANYNGDLWGNTIYLGSPAYPKCKERFYLVLVGLDSDANEFLTGEMTKQGKANNFTGFGPGELPDGIEKLAELEVETAGSINSCAP